MPENGSENRGDNPAVDGRSGPAPRQPEEGTLKPPQGAASWQRDTRPASCRGATPHDRKRGADPSSNHPVQGCVRCRLSVTPTRGKKMNIKKLDLRINLGIDTDFNKALSAAVKSKRMTKTGYIRDTLLNDLVLKGFLPIKKATGAVR